MDFEKIVELYSGGNLNLLDWATITVFFLFLSLLKWGAINIWKTWRESKLPNSHDLEVWQKINGKIDRAHIDYWKKHYVCDCFPSDLLHTLEDFIEEFKFSSPHTKFLDKKLEKQKDIFVQSAKDFFYAVLDVGYDEHGDKLKLIRDYSMPDKFQEMQKDLESKAEKMVISYDNFAELVIKRISNNKVGKDA